MQKTIQKTVSVSGVGVHSGIQATLTLRPADENTGIVFVRTDVTDKDNVIPAAWDLVTDTMLCTVIENKDGVRVSTLEHLMAALLGIGIDNLIIELNAEEVPIMDGSAKDFVHMLDEAGIKVQDAPRKYIKIEKEVRFELDGKETVLKPASIPTYSFEIDFSEKNAVIGQQTQTIQLINGNFRHEISEARTFGLLEEVEHLKSIGLARGGSLENAIVVDKNKILNPEGLRFDNEFVRHKILDAIGDLYLAGAPIVGHFEGYKAGHEMNNKILRTLFADPDAWSWAS